MDYIYLTNFTKTHVDNIEVIHNVIDQAEGIVDKKVFPIIEEAETGNYLAMAELFDSFTYGINNIQPSFAMAKHYWTKIQEVNLKSGDKEVISEGLNNYAYLHYQFDLLEKATELFLEAFKFMVCNLPPEQWDKKIIKLVSDNMDIYHPNGGE